MAVSSITSAPRSRKRHKPSPELVYREYCHQVMRHGERGVYVRLGKLFGVSDETARRWVLKHEQKTTAIAEQPPELAYTPAPGETEYAQERARIAQQLADAALLASLLDIVETPQSDVEASPAMDGEITSIPRSGVAIVLDGATDETPHCHTYELPFAPRCSWSEATNVSRLMWVGAILLTLETIGLASVHLGLALVIMIPTLGMWWCAAEARRL